VIRHSDLHTRISQLLGEDALVHEVIFDDKDVEIFVRYVVVCKNVGFEQFVRLVASSTRKKRFLGAYGQVDSRIALRTVEVWTQSTLAAFHIKRKGTADTGFGCEANGTAVHLSKTSRDEETKAGTTWYLLAKYVFSSQLYITIVDMRSWRGLGKASEEKLVFFVAQATTRVLHGEDDIDLVKVSKSSCTHCPMEAHNFALFPIRL
jgi:hypothetical protein